MKRIALTALAATALFLPAMAQNSVTNNPDNRAYFGVRGSLDITCPGNVKALGIGMDIFKNGAGFNAGAIYNIPVVANFYVEPGVKVYYNTYSADSNIIDAVDEDIDGMSVRKFGFRIPVMAGYHFDFTDALRLHVFTGPELEIGATAKAHATYNGASMSESLYDEGGLRRFDCLWDFGVGMDINKVYVGVSGALGLCNMMDESGVTFHENRVSITLGYNF